MSSDPQADQQKPQDLRVEISDCGFPVSAPLSLRALAFLADSALVFLLAALGMKLLLPVFCPQGVSAFLDIYGEISALYESAAVAAANGQAVPAIETGPILTKAAEDEAIVDLYGTAYLIAFFSGVLYFTLTEMFMKGQTLGKKIVRIRTVTFGAGKLLWKIPGINGNAQKTFVLDLKRPPTLWETLPRATWKSVTIFPVDLLLLLLAAGNAIATIFSKRHRGWIDKFSRTEVIDERGPQHNTAN